MGKADSSQKFIGRNRPPRVQIEYDVELYGAEQKVELPFVMGIMSDLSGKSNVPKAKLMERKFLEVDMDNFEDRMASIKPRATFRVPNTLTGDGELSIDLEFESMDDFSPGKIARKVDSLNRLMTAREELSNLISYMDGKDNAEELINNILNDQEMLKSLMAAKKQKNESSETENSETEEV